MSGELVTVFGGSGFIGKAVVQHLAKAGYRVRVAVRHPNNALHVKPLGDLGQVQISQANLRNRSSVEAAIFGADYVINLVGILYESGAQTFDKVHHKGAELIAKVSADASVKKFIHLSAIGADLESTSKYARSKAAGEVSILKAYPKATIVRPSIVFGPDDLFFNKFAGLAKLFRVMPVICGKTKMQPVYVGDVAAAIGSIIGRLDTQGKTYELGGPKVFTFRALLEMVNSVTELNATMISIPIHLAYFQAFFFGMFPNPMVTIDQLKLLEHDNVVGSGKTFSDLGITPTPTEAIVPNYLMHYKPSGQFKGAN
jgi:uncharacterized protein YbjT (DUF2867 family)